MKRGRWIWRLLFLVGVSPFLVAAGYCLVTYLLSSDFLFPKATFWELLFLYSLLYWPTYVLGLALIALSAVMLRKKQ